MALRKEEAYPVYGIEGWEFASPYQEKISIDELTIHLCGFQARHDQLGEVVGSAAEPTAYPRQRAYYEALERISILESLDRPTFSLKSMTDASFVQHVPGDVIFPPSCPETNLGAESPPCQYSKSNGVALHTSWEEACRRACLELVERHLVLASWLGQIKPEIQHGTAAASSLQGLSRHYVVVNIDFGQQEVSCFVDPICVSGVALLPKAEAAPLILGFGAGLTKKDSRAKAEAETLQRLGFLWGEEIPSQEPDFAPTALYHQEYFLLPDARDKIENWLNGGHVTRPGVPPRKPGCLSVQFADLSCPKISDLWTAKAIAPAAIPLVFGRWTGHGFDTLPAELLIHPIA
jgi:hypothetical protein